MYTIRTHSFHTCENTHLVFFFLSSCSLSIPVPNLCAHRDRESRPPEPDSLHRDTYLGVAGNQVFGERLPRLLTSEIVFFHSGESSFWWTFARIRLLPLRRVFFLVDRDRLLRLLPGGRSRDCTANIFLHRLWSATSSNALCRLV